MSHSSHTSATAHQPHPLNTLFFRNLTEVKYTKIQPKQNTITRDNFTKTPQNNQPKPQLNSPQNNNNNKRVNSPPSKGGQPLLRYEHKKLNAKLKDFVDKNQKEEAYKYFNELKAAKSVDIYSYHMMMTMERSNTKAVVALLEDLTAAGMTPNHAVYGAIIGSFVENGDITQAIKYYTQMRKEGIAVPLHIYDSLGALLAKKRDGPKLERLIEAIKKDNQKPTNFQYNLLLTTYFHNGDIPKLLEGFQRMEEDSVIPNTAAYNIIISAYARAYDKEKMLEWLEKAEKVQKVDTRSYQPVIMALAKMGDTSLMVSMVDRMKARSVTVDKTIFGALLTGWRNTSNVANMISTLREMKEAGYPINAYDVSQIITSLGRNGRLAEMRKVFDAMTGIVKSSIAIYNSMLSSYAFAEDLNAMEACFDEIVKSGLAPDHITYTTLIDAYGKAGNLAKIGHWYSEMCKAGVPRDSKTHASILSAMAKHGFMSAAETLFEKLKAENMHKDSAIYNTLISGWGTNKDPDKALEWFSVMQNDGVAPDLVTYKILLLIHMNENNEEKVLEVMNQIENDPKVKPDNMVYNMVIFMYKEQKNYAQMLHWVDVLQKRGLKLSMDAFNTIIEGLAHGNMANELVGWCQKMMESGFTANPELLHLIRRTLERTGKAATAKDLLHQLEDKTNQYMKAAKSRYSLESIEQII